MQAQLEGQEKELQHEALSIIKQASIIKIVDQSSYDDACKLLLEAIKPMRKRWQTYWNSVREPAYRAYQAILDKFNEGDKPLEAAERQVKAAIGIWDAEQERIRQELQRKAEAEARAKEEEERLQAAMLAEASGATEEQVDSIVSAPVAVVAPPVEPTYVKAAGVSSRENWKCRVTDIKALCKAVAAGKVPPNYVLANESVLNARAKADRQTMNIPGCIPFNDPIISGRTR